MNIRKDTKIFGSFAENAGNNGCRMFNAAFSYHGIDAIYRSFSVDNIEDAVNAAKTLGFSGFAITMPFKKEVIKYVDNLSDPVKAIGAANTVIRESDGTLTAYNTDYLAAKEYIVTYPKKPLFILGNGGYSAAVQQAAKDLGYNPIVITRDNWSAIETISDALIYNCTPVKVEDLKIQDSNYFIDCQVETATGYNLSVIQARHQFKLYTGLDKFPIA